VRTDREDNGTFGIVGPTNYGFCEGDWFVWAGPGLGPITRSAFGPDLSRRWAQFTDGTSQTMLMAEVKNWQPYIRDCGTLSQINNPISDYEIEEPDREIELHKDVEVILSLRDARGNVVRREARYQIATKPGLAVLRSDP
jgi:hypothetical protein